MRFTLILIALICPLRAELLATFETTQGNVTVALQYDKAPQAVANFITMAQGTRNRIIQNSGAVTNAPLYVGEKFFRVLNQIDFKIAQTGSGTGTNTGSTGFTFKDEFDASLPHVPYVLSMANSGPNSNGSQIFFTGNVSIPSLDNVHTVFGLITDPASRAVVDAIMAAGDNGTTTNAVTFSRTDAAAIAFDEHAQGLPMVSRAPGSLMVNRNVSATWSLAGQQDTGDLFRAFRSSTMVSGSWVEILAATRRNGFTTVGESESISPVFLDTAAAEKAFYNLSLVKHPGAVTPSTLANRTVVIVIADEVITSVFDATGLAGTTTVNSGGSVFSGAFVSIDPATGSPGLPSMEAHNFTAITDTASLNPRYLMLRVGCDSVTDPFIVGRHASQFFNGFGWVSLPRGTATITR